MANEIQILHDDAAETLYAIVRNQAGQFYAGATPETFEAANWATYDIALAAVDTTSPPATGNVALQGTFPAVAAGVYWLDLYVQAGASPAQTDYRIASMLVEFDGTVGHTLTQPEASAANIDSTGGTLSMAKAVEAILAWAGGKASYDAATGIATYYGQDGVTVILTTPLLGGGNRNAPTIG
jgi:hypothetical protein